MANHYETLGVGRGAASAEIKTAYLRLAKERHPDRFTDPAERKRADDFFKDLTAAFKTLSGTQARQEYDRSLDNPEANSPAEQAKDAWNRGVQALKAGDFHTAAELLRAAAHLAPEEHRYHSALSTALSQYPQASREAIEAVEAAVRLAPKHAPYQLQLARLQLASGLKLRARKTIEIARALDPVAPEIQALWSELRPAEEEAEAAKRPESGGLSGLFRRRS